MTNDATETTFLRLMVSVHTERLRTAPKRIGNIAFLKNGERMVKRDCTGIAVFV